MKYSLSLYAAVLATALPVDAQIINGDFESGSFPPWDHYGLSFVESFADISIQVPLFDEFVATLSTPDSLLNSGVSVDLSVLESELGLSPGDLANDITDITGISNFFQGSAISQTFSVNAGDILSLDLNFMTTEFTGTEPDNTSSGTILIPGPPGQSPVKQDAIFLTLDTLGVIAADVVREDAFVPLIINQPAFPDLYTSGTFTFEYVFPVSGTVELGIGILNQSDNDGLSILLVDNVNVIPEPSEIALFIVPLLSVAAWLQKRRKSQT